MENTELMNAPQTAEMLEKVLVNGDLATLTPSQRLDYYRQVCQSCGLNPLTRPFDYMRLNGKLTLYARKDATDQLRQIHGVSIDDVDIQETDKLFRVKVKGHNQSGRSDVEIGVVAKTDMQGNLANIEMKAVTKAKRRFTLSICGLGWLDETEIETIPQNQAQPVIVDEKGEIMGEIEARNANNGGSQAKPKNYTPEQKTPAEAPKTAEFDEAGFLREWRHRVYVDGTEIKLQAIGLQKAGELQTTKGKLFSECSVQMLYYMWNAYGNRVRNPQTTDSVRETSVLKLSAINEILTARAGELEEREKPADPSLKGESND